MSPFEALSDDPVLHICSYLRGRDLLNLSGVNTTSNRIIKKSKESMNKMRLVLNKDSLADLNDVITFAISQKFIAMKLAGIYNIQDYPVNFFSLLLWLRESVEDLVIEDTILEKNQFREMIQIFLPKLKTCTIDRVYIRYNVTTDNAGTYSNGGKNHPLEALKLKKTDYKIMRFFVGCNRLKTFDDGKCGGLQPDLDDQAQQQSQLISRKLDWNRLNCFQLEELTTSFGAENYEGASISMFLDKLPRLKKLDIKISGYCLPLHFMRAICNAPKLEDLQIQAPCGCQVYDEPPHQLVNYTVKKLRLKVGANIAERFFKSLRRVESIDLDTYPDTLDLTDVPLVALHSFKLSCTCWCSFKFSPINVPENVESFESAVMAFVINSTQSIIGFIKSITVGHKNWSNYGNFRLSNAFCEGLVERSSQLEYLELYNVADRKSFYLFLSNLMTPSYFYSRSMKRKTAVIVEPKVNEEAEPKQ